jgi:hypothetical protein
MVQDILWKADSHSACQTIACFLYGTQSFIIVLTKSCHWTLSWASRIQFAPSIPMSLMSIIMSNIPRSKSHILFQLLSSCQRISPGPRRFETFRNILAPHSTPKLGTTPCRPSATAYSIYSQLPSIYGSLLHPQPEDVPCHGDNKST